jgi:translocation and assembly module TamA
MVGGCTALQPLMPGRAPADVATDVAAAAQATPAPKPLTVQPAAQRPALRLTIEAPSALATLLQRHLDVARLSRATDVETLGDDELRRIEQITPSQAQSLLETEGYVNAKVRVERSKDTSIDPPQTVLTVFVDEGPRVTVQRLKLDLLGPLGAAAEAGDLQAKSLQETLRVAWPLGVGNDFRNPSWVDAKANLLARLRAEGYAAASLLGSSATIDAERNTVWLAVVADSGPRYKLGTLRIEGLSMQEEETVRNLAGFRVGAPATEVALLDYQDRLIRSGLFDRVSVTLDTDRANPEGTPVLVRVQETRLQQATVGVGYSAKIGPRVSLEHTHRRIGGERATLRNKFELARLRQAWDGELLSHAQPNLFRNLVGGSFERLEATDASDVLQSVRVRAGRVRETTEEEQLSFAQLERVARTTATSREAVTGASLNHHATWRRVDSVILPTQGVSLTLQTGAGVASGPAGRGPYGRVLARLGLWQPLPGNFYGYARVEAGQVFTREGLAVPQTQLFRAGGDESVRGYAYRSLGPVSNGVVGGGKVAFSGTVEVARPVTATLPSVWWAVFGDVGQAANRWGDIDPVWGAGVGLRWRSPVGPLSVDWAYGQAVRRSRLHLSVGIVF